MPCYGRELPARGQGPLRLYPKCAHSKGFVKRTQWSDVDLQLVAVIQGTAELPKSVKTAVLKMVRRCMPQSH